MCGRLLGNEEAEQIAAHPLRGSLFETFIISELMKSRFNQGERPDLFFWRDSNGNEVDVIGERGGKLVPLEIKSGKTLTSESTKNLKRYISLAKDKCTSPTLIYGGEESYTLNKINITGWRQSSGVM